MATALKAGPNPLANPTNTKTTNEQRNAVVDLGFWKYSWSAIGATVVNSPTASINPKLPLTSISTVDSIHRS